MIRTQPEDVACGLHQPLPLDDPLPVVLVLAATEQRLEHRLRGLLDLEEERVALVAAEQQEDPAARADAAHSDDLTREIDETEAFQQVLPVRLQRAPVQAEDLRDAFHDLLAVPASRQL